jgi:Cu+-exporting ATPase
MKAFISVLIVACPCALALAAPFALGTAQRLLARRHVFLKDPHVTETLARVDTVVFDKTGTLTAPGAADVAFRGAPLEAGERAALAALTRQSTHPYSARLAGWLAEGCSALPTVTGFEEHPGAGVAGTVDGRSLLLGSPAWLGTRGVVVAAGEATAEPGVQVALDGRHRGAFRIRSRVRPETAGLLEHLAETHEVALLSGDSERERERFRAVFPAHARLQFNQSPRDKLGFVDGLQRAGRTVMMVGDGLNDAGALKQSDVGVAVVERVGIFSPASDVILDAARVGELPGVLRFSGAVVRIVRVSFLLSSLYNLVGIGIAASGRLSPLVCAILMPLSSVTVVAFACGATNRAAWRAGIPRPVPAPDPGRTL